MECLVCMAHMGLPSHHVEAGERIMSRMPLSPFDGRRRLGVVSSYNIGRGIFDIWRLGSLGPRVIKSLAA
jgi:hypothetical protein